ncbi:hypothetical protein ACF046_00295 [Glutamicibacter creatinolyticus]|uniref:hypothetical protein n=1 Tax=Glutamicibacter creatinolyticus TaxID=162496 RepID=UPI0033F3F79E
MARALAEPTCRSSPYSRRGRRAARPVARRRIALPAPLADDRGSSIVEFIFTSTLVLIPMIYLVLAAGQIQAASYAAVGSADHAAKVFAASTEASAAEAYAHDVVGRTLRDFGIPAQQAQTTISCSPACLEPGSTVSVTVTVRVPLPLLPEGFTASVLTVDSAATQRVDRFG